MLGLVLLSRNIGFNFSLFSAGYKLITCADIVVCFIQLRDAVTIVPFVISFRFNKLLHKMTHLFVHLLQSLLIFFSVLLQQ